MLFYVDVTEILIIAEFRFASSEIEYQKHKYNYVSLQNPWHAASMYIRDYYM